MKCMTNAKNYWPWQKVYWYGVAAGYVLEAYEEHLGDELLLAIDDDNVESAGNWLTELEESGAVRFRSVKLSHTNLHRYFTEENPSRVFISDAEKHDNKRKLQDFDFDKAYASIAELVNDKNAGADFLRSIYHVDVKISNIQWIERQLKSYLDDFVAGKLVSTYDQPYYSFAYQRQQLANEMEKLQSRYGNVLPLSGEQLTADKSEEWLFNIPELLYSLSDERVLNVLTLHWNRDDETNHLSFTFTITPSNATQNNELTPTNRMSYGGVEFDESEVYYDGRPIELQPRQAAVLIKLLEKKGAVATYSELIDVYYSDEISQDNTRLDNKESSDLLASIYTAVGEIRKRLAQYTSIMLELKTVSKTGYRLLKKI